MSLTTSSSAQVRSTAGRMHSWITYGNADVSIGTQTGTYFIDRINLHVTEAFDGGADNNISIGYDGDEDAFGTNTACNTTGRKTVTMGVNTGVNDTGREIKVYYTYGGAAPTTGKAYVEVYYSRIPVSP